MQCQYQTPLTDEQIWDALDGITNAQVHDHLATCEACHTRYEEARQFEMQLRRSVHPPPQILANYHAKLLDARIENLIQSHIEGCLVCQDELKLMDTLAEDVDIPNSYEISTPPKRRPAPSARAAISRGDSHREFRMRLILPNRGTGVQTAGINVLGHSAAVTTAEADGLRIHMMMEAVRAGVILSGQVITRDEADQPRWESAVLSVTNLDLGKRAMTLLNDLGEFTCMALPAGLAYLRIRARDGQTIVLDEFPLADPSEKE
jgi:hypothetical protein